MREIRHYNLPAIQSELREINSKYHLSDVVLRRINSYYNIHPAKLGNVSVVLDFLRILLGDYGYNDEEFSQFLNSSVELIQCNPNELKRKVVILGSCDFLDRVLFEKPYMLLDTTNISSKSLYAIIKDLKSSGIELNFDTLFCSRTTVELKNLREKYPLTVSKFNSCVSCYNVKRKLLRKQNNPQLVLEKKSEN